VNKILISEDKLGKLTKIGRLLTNGEISPEKADEMIDEALGPILEKKDEPEIEYRAPEELEAAEVEP